MKKQLLILSIGLLGLTSCQKEEKDEMIQQEEVYHTVRFVGLINDYMGYCKINGVEVEPFNLVTGAPEYKCYSGDRLELKDTGYDVLPTVQGFVESYIVVDSEIVKEYSGYGDANLIYVIP
jgi:hypothetical protein